MIDQIQLKYLKQFKNLLILSFLLSIGLLVEMGVAYSQAVTIVQDDNKRHQIEREVAWSQWEGHSPKFFYWAIELFQKDNYRDKDRRNMLQLLPTLLAVRFNERETEKYKEEVEKWEKQELFKLADYEIDLAYEFVKKELNECRAFYTLALQRAKNAGVYAEMQSEISNEQERIEGRIYVIRNSTLTNADRREEYFNEIKAYKKLIDMTIRITKIFESVKK
jgi:hypothetical protein